MTVLPAVVVRAARQTLDGRGSLLVHDQLVAVLPPRPRERRDDIAEKSRQDAFRLAFKDT